MGAHHPSSTMLSWAGRDARKLDNGVGMWSRTGRPWSEKLDHVCAVSALPCSTIALDGEIVMPRERPPS